MRQAVRLMVLIAFASNVFAESSTPKLVLDNIHFQMSAKQWVTTQSALLRVTIHVTLTKADLVKARAEIMEKLKKIGNGEWHLTQFNRSQDSSGLESLFVQAQARINQADLTDIYQNAKSASIPGARYDISGVEFLPSLEEVQQVKAKVREQLYQQVNEEIARINKVYPNQSYSVKELSISEGETPVPMQRAYKAAEMNAAVMAAEPAPMLAVSNQIILTADVIASSNRKQGN